MSVVERTLPLPEMPSGRAWRTAPLRRLEWLLDESQLTRSAGARRIRLFVGGLFVFYGLVLEVMGATRGDLVELKPLTFVLGSLPILMGRLGRLGRYFIPVFLGLFAYGFAAGYVTKFKLGVHHSFQIGIDRFLGGGTVPSVWLQQHLYHGKTGVLEAACVVVYLGHFFVPLALGTYLALTDRLEDFKRLMFSILVVCVMGTITFMLLPTAPPWLAAQEGHLGSVHHLLKMSMADMHMKALSALEGDARKYDVTAALPSLHAAIPLISLLVAVRARLRRGIVVALAANFAAVLFAIVYLGEHYVVDALVGVAYAVVAVLIVTAALGSERPEDEQTTESTHRTGGLAHPRGQVS